MKDDALKLYFAELTKLFTESYKTFRFENYIVFFFHERVWNLFLLHFVLCENGRSVTILRVIALKALMIRYDFISTFQCINVIPTKSAGKLYIGVAFRTHEARGNTIFYSHMTYKDACPQCSLNSNNQRVKFLMFFDFSSVLCNAIQ